jgi:hypothetical protein
MNSNFYKKKIISQENQTIQNIIKGYKLEPRNIELSNKVKKLKNINQGICILIFTFIS